MPTNFTPNKSMLFHFLTHFSYLVFLPTCVCQTTYNPDHLVTLAIPANLATQVNMAANIGPILPRLDVVKPSFYLCSAFYSIKHLPQTIFCDRNKGNLEANSVHISLPAQDFGSFKQEHSNLCLGHAKS